MLTSLTTIAPPRLQTTRPTARESRPLPQDPQPGFARTRTLGANLDLADRWADVASAVDDTTGRLPDHWQDAADRLQTEVTRNTPDQTFQGRRSDGSEQPVDLDANLESTRRQRLEDRVGKYTDEGGPREGLRRFQDRSDAAARNYVDHGLVRLDQPGEGWQRYPADPLNCRGDALRRWTRGDHFVGDADAGYLMNALGAQNVSEEQAQRGDLVGFNVHGQPGDADYKIGHLATVTGFDSDGHPLVGGRDGDYGVWLGRSEDWQAALPGQVQFYHIPQESRLEGGPVR